MNNYNDLKLYISKGRDKTERKIDNNTIARFDGDDIVIRYHATDICIIYPDNSRRLYTGGWRTFTTKDRLNKLILPPLRLYQENGIWYLWNYQTSEKWLFEEGITILPDNTVLDYGLPSAESKDKKLRKRIRKYAKDYMVALIAGEVGKPDSGDCWMCLLKTSNGQTLGDATDNTDHLESHMDEKYYPGSLFYNAIGEYRVSQMAMWGLQALWYESPEGDMKFAFDILREQGYKSLVKYLNSRFGLAR